VCGLSEEEVIVKLIDETMRAFSFYEQQQSNCPSRDCPRTPKRASASFMQSGEVEKFSVLHLRVKTVIYRMSIFFESIIAYKPRKSVPRNSSHVQRTNAYITWYYARVTPLFGSHIDILPFYLLMLNSHVLSILTRRSLHGSLEVFQQ
jgi:hypothetical protein